VRNCEESSEVFEQNKPYIKKVEDFAQESNNLPDLLGRMRRYLDEHFDSFDKEEVPYFESILESRFLPAEHEFDNGMRSCGSKTNISAEMLRHLGYEVKKVHGSVPKSIHHAWISIKNPESDEWKQYDLTQKNNEVTSEHNVIAICDEWEEIKDVLKEAHEEWLETLPPVDEKEG